MSDLTTSIVARQNLLNNPSVIEETKKVLGIQSIPYSGKEYVTKAMAARFYGIDSRTIDRYLAVNENELFENGYRVLRGIEASRFANHAAEVLKVTPKQGIVQLGVFDMRSFLNLGMLLTESENAKLLRKTMLDIVMDFINQRTGGSTKYVNQRDSHFLNAYLQEYDYRKEFTNALDHYVDAGAFKYASMTNRVYQSIFCEKASEYKQVLQLKAKDRIRDTMYAEVLDLISAYEHGFAKELEGKANELKRKLTLLEAYGLFDTFASQPLLEPLVNQARSKMASRDLAFREAFHDKLEQYIRPLTTEEIHHFFGPESDEVERITSEHREQISALSECDAVFEKLLADNEDVLKRLKERE